MHTGRARGVLVGSILATASCFQPTDIETDDVAGDSETDGDGTGQEGQGSEDTTGASASQDGTASAEGSADADGTGDDPTSPTTADPTVDASDDDASESGTDPTDATATEPTSGDPTTTDDPTTSDPTTDDPTDSGECMPQCGTQECGNDPVCGEACGACDAGETCLDDGDWCGTEYGQPDDLGFSGNVNADVLFGHRFTLAEAVELRRFGVLAGGVGSARMALFAHDGGGPGLLVAESEVMDLAAGANESDVDPVALAAGTYWIGIVVEAVTPLRRTAIGDDTHEQFYTVVDFDAVMPASVDDDVVFNDLLYNLYVVVDDDD